MIVFPPLRTKRLDVRVQELTIGDEIALCQLPTTSHEKALTEFLRRAVEASAPTENHVADPRAWTVQERYLALAHYCISTRDDGPDYAVTESSKLSDYLMYERDYALPYTFRTSQDEWRLGALTGAAAEVIESLQLDAALPRRAHWTLAIMAAQLLHAQRPDPPDAALDPSAYGEWLKSRMTEFRNVSSSSFDELFAAFRVAHYEAPQFFRIWVDEEGVIVQPKEAEGIVPSARFLVLACVGELARGLAGKA
ncbi:MULTISPECIES: hypothetical protein [Burkholderia cepacia complex]|jgi:hypothetical protein|uniref:hypothetical protein n=1 Tax=Burkholderia cepacia complex TaxID=87882 RepID=UPI00158C3F68|nr:MULTISPECIES: hypothetical protein [Burkholderia cepacia complex]MCA8037124.1 hypothetical protein [Burkholderia arboris]